MKLSEHQAVFLETLPGAISWSDQRSDCYVEVGDRDRSVEDADGDIVSGVLSFCEDPVCRSAGE